MELLKNILKYVISSVAYFITNHLKRIDHLSNLNYLVTVKICNNIEIQAQVI